MGSTPSTHQLAADALLTIRARAGRLDSPLDETASMECAMQAAVECSTLPLVVDADWLDALASESIVPRDDGSGRRQQL